MNKYSIVDIETTGGRKEGHKIIEIGIVNIDGNEIVEEYSTLINPERNIPISITYLTGIKNEMVENSPKFYEVAKKIVEMTEGRIFVAHNVFFDYNFLKMEFSELRYAYKRERMCTVRLSRKYIPGHKSYSLGKLCTDLGIEIIGRHRALGDARATSIIFKMIQGKLKNEDIYIEDASSVVLPSQLNPEVYKNLPETIGIYYFFNKDNEIIYIGKSKNIKKRVGQHLRTNLKRKKDMELKGSISHIEYRKTECEIAALLLECHEIKEKNPRFNRALKGKRFPYGVKLKVGKDGCAFIKIYTSIELENFFYVFKSRKAAQSKIDKVYSQILGSLDPFERIEDKVMKLVSVIGQEKYNKILEKAFYQNVPQDDHFMLVLPQKTEEEFQINVYDKKPLFLISMGERFSFSGDPELKLILWNYLLKVKKTNLIKIDLSE